VDVRAGPKRAAVADRGVLGLEGAVLLRVRLDLLSALSVQSLPMAVSVRSVM
jgi:hypothetical protein